MEKIDENRERGWGKPEKLACGGRGRVSKVLIPGGRNPIHSRGSCIQTNNGGWGVAFHQVTHDWSVSAGKVRAMS